MTTDKEELRDLKFYMNNAMDDFASTPISVLRYITELESKLEAKDKEIEKLKEQVLIGDIYADSVARDAWDRACEAQLNQCASIIKGHGFVWGHEILIQKTIKPEYQPK